MNSLIGQLKIRDWNFVRACDEWLISEKSTTKLQQKKHFLINPRPDELFMKMSKKCWFLD